MTQKVWKVRGYQGTDRLFEWSCPVRAFTEADMRSLLQRLVSMHLERKDIISASLKKGAKGYTSHLEVLPNRGGKPGFMTTGTDYHYSATIDED